MNCLFILIKLFLLKEMTDSLISKFKIFKERCPYLNTFPIDCHHRLNKREHCKLGNCPFFRGLCNPRAILKEFKALPSRDEALKRIALELPAVMDSKLKRKEVKQI